jgi:hypothetical protein
MNKLVELRTMVAAARGWMGNSGQRHNATDAFAAAE